MDGWGLFDPVAFAPQIQVAGGTPLFPTISLHSESMDLLCHFSAPDIVFRDALLEQVVPGTQLHAVDGSLIGVT